MIVVHGGRLVCESGSAFKPEIFINNFVGQDRNIVVVTFNYRLGVFGFGVFNGETGDTNVAMYDMLEAVKWVRKEIDQFGGNKDRITMAGHSAGAGLIVDFTSSTLSKGLLHQQIVMSAPLQDISKSANFKGMTIVAQNVGCIPKEYGFRKLSKTQINKTYLCLQNKSAQDLLHAQLSMQQNSTFYFGSPRVDGDFITDYPDNLFNFNTIYPINTFIGTTTGELRDSLYITDPKNDRIKEQLLKNMCEHVGYELFEKPEEFTKKCGNYYKNGTDAQFLSDDMEFYSGAIKVANAHKRANSKVFMYSYDYKGAGTAFHKYLEAPSPHHSEDLIYTFGTSRGPFVAKDYVIERIYSGMLANFINFEDPSPSKTQQWRQYTQEKREYFLIDFDKNFTMPGMKDHYYTRALDFWSTAGKKSFSERFSPSLDNFVMSILTDPIVSHLKGVASGPDKSIEQFEKVFNERESFLEELKLRRKLKLEKKIGVQMRNSVVEFEKDADQGTSGGVLSEFQYCMFL